MKKKVLCVIGASPEAIKLVSKIMLFRVEKWPDAQGHFA